MSLFDQVKESISKVLAVDESEIKLESTFVEDLKADSLDMVKLMMQFEEDFKVVIDDDQAEGLKTVGDVVKFLEVR